MTQQERIIHIEKINTSGLTGQAKLDALRSFVEQEKKGELKKQENEAEQKQAVELKNTPQKVQITNEPSDIAKAFFSMLKGEKGDKPSGEELLSLIKPLIPDPIKGKDGQDGQDGEDGKTPTKQELIKIIKPLIPKVKDGYTPVKGVDYFDGKDGIVKTEIIVQEVLKLINSSKSKEKLHIKNIDGVSDLQDRIVTHAVTQARGLLYAGLFDNKIKAGSNITITTAGDGGVTVSSTGGGGSSSMETATPTANPLVWTVVNNPVMIIADNMPFYNGVGVDVTGSGPYTLTFSNAPTTVACLHN